MYVSRDKISRDKNLQDFWRFSYRVTQPSQDLLLTSCHFQNRLGEDPGDEVGDKILGNEVGIFHGCLHNMQKLSVKTWQSFHIGELKPLGHSSHLHCASLLRLIYSVISARSCTCTLKTWQICLDIEFFQLKNGYSSLTSSGTLVSF